MHPNEFRCTINTTHDTMEKQEDSKKWTHNYKTLLLNTRLEMEKEFRAKKKTGVVLWECVLHNIKSIDSTFPFSRDDIHRKFLNFMVTYKRIKKRNRTSSEAATTWDFYDRMDEVYGSRSSISLPLIKKWTHNYKILLLNTRLEMDKEFREKKKSSIVLWERVLQNIRSIDNTFPFSRDDIHRKFLNFMVTYKRIKKRKKISGEAATSWDFYDRMDEAFGHRSDIYFPDSNLESSFDTAYANSTEDSNESCTFEAAPTQHSSSPPARKRKRVDIVEFLIKENQADRKLLEDLLQSEKERLNIEKEKIKEMRKLREALLAVRR